MEQFIIPAVIGLVGVVAGALITNWFQRKKVNSDIELNDAEINEKIRVTCVGLIEPLSKKITALEVELQDWKDCADARAEQLRKVNIIPVPFKSSKKSKGIDA
jgi:hypothetical protein